MGCENSKTVRVLPVGKTMSKDNTNMVAGKEGTTQTPKAKSHKPTSARREATEYFLDEHGNKVKKSKHEKRPLSPNTRDLTGSSHSLDDRRSMDSDRGFSATSKQSADSGLGEDYSHMITEFSEQNKVQEVEQSFKPHDDLELSVTGVQCGTRNSAKDRARLEEAQVMQTLREEGLISKPAAEAAGGMCFEIVDATGDGRSKPPPKLEKLALERRKKKKRALTEDEIREKLERAERRRKKREQERLDKLREMERTDAVAALDAFVQYQRSKEETIAQRLDQVQENRDRKQRELKEKQEHRKRHAEEVRKRKALAKESGAPDQDFGLNEPEGTPRPEMTTALSCYLAAELPPPLRVQEAKERSSSQGTSRSGSRPESAQSRE